MCAQAPALTPPLHPHTPPPPPSYEVRLTGSELEDCQWYDRAELAAAVAAYEAGSSGSSATSHQGRVLPLPELQQRCWASQGFFVPPPFAIAHHLVKLWVQRGEPWFPAGDGTAAMPRASLL